MNKLKIVDLHQLVLKLSDRGTGRKIINSHQIGQAVFEHVTNLFDEMEEGVIVLDFSGITSVSLSSATLLGPDLHKKYLRTRIVKKKLYFAYSGFGQDQLSAWKRMFSGEGQKPVCVFGDYIEKDGGVQFSHPQIFGELPDSLREIVDYIYANGATTSKMLTSAGIVAPSRKLNQLSNKYPQLLRWEKNGGADWHYVHLPIVPMAVS